MFTVSKNPTFTHTVDVIVPKDGGHVKQSLKARFRVIDSASDAEDFDLNTTDGLTSFLKLSIEHFDDLVDDADQPVPYSDELRDQLIKLPYIRAALGRAYLDAVTKSKLGN